MTRRSERYFDAISTGADTNLASARTISVGRDGYVALQGYVDNGAGGAPTDTPLGTIELYASARGQRFTLLSSSALSSELAKLAPAGNAIVDGWAIVTGVPGTAIKLRYKRTSGGGGNSRLTLDVVSW